MYYNQFLLLTKKWRSHFPTTSKQQKYVSPYPILSRTLKS